MATKVPEHFTWRQNHKAAEADTAAEADKAVVALKSEKGIRNFFFTKQKKGILDKLNLINDRRF